MFIVKFIRFIIGYVTFSAYGGFPERFVNLCTKNRIPLWNIKYTRKCLTANTTVKGYKGIRQSAHRSGVKAKIEKKHGLPFFLARNKVRSGLVIGISAAAIIVMLLSTMVWSVTVEGNKTISDEEVLAVFSDLGVEIGAFKSGITVSDVTDEAAKRIDKINWVSLNIIGSRAEIIVSEKIEAPQFPKTDIPCNIIAAEDGTVTRIEGLVGKEMVKVGDIVLKGELLISGITTNLDKSETLKTARGNVYARVNKTIITTNSEELFLRETEEKTRYILYFFGLEIPFSIKVSNENYSKTESYLTNGSILLPVGYIREHSYSMANEAALPEDCRNLYSAKKYADEYKQIFETSEIISETLTADFNGDYASYKGEFECQKEIGQVKEIFVEKN